MRLIGGKKVADKILAKLKKDIVNRSVNPGLAVILVGNNPASEIYVKLKAKAAKRIGIRFKLIKFSARVAEKTIISTIKNLNEDGKVNGIIVQLPLPNKFPPQKIINAIDPRKDADGFHPKNLKNFLAGKPSVYPVFPLAIMKMLESVKSNLNGKKAVIIANSKEFGTTMAQALKRNKIKASYLFAKDLKNIKTADIIVTAVGKPGFIKGSMLKKGAIVIDGGITKKSKKVLGDVDFESVKSVASYLSPVPGGVGPVTISCLLQNVATLAEKSIKAVIFDMDGTLSDTEIFHATIEKEMLKKYGIAINTEKIADKYSGIPVKVFFKEIFDAHNISADMDKIVEEKQRLMLARSRGHIKPVPGVLNLIKKVQKSGLKIALGTSSQKRLVSLILRELGLKKVFKIAVTIEDVERGKPNPDIFLLAAKKMGVAPEECIVIEDGRSGMLAAKRAGMRCVGLVKDRNSKDYPADILVENLSEINISKLLD